MLYDIDYLRKKLSLKKNRINTRYDYYDMKNRIRYFSKLMPDEYRWIAYSLGWCGKAVDSIADRLSFNEFRNDNMYFGEIFDMNNKDVLFDSAILSALISSCSFIYIRQQDNDYPVSLEVIDGSHATGIIDSTTNLLKYGYAVLEYDENDNPTKEAYFTPDETVFYEKGLEPYSAKNPAKYPLLVPIIYKPDAKRPFGHSRISRACMELQQGALRTLLRMEVSSEFYSFPQKYIVGLTEDAEFNGQVAKYSNFFRVDTDGEGEKPTLGQFQQQSMTPHIDTFKMYASAFSGETGLTLDDLGFPSVNPSSAESIKTTHESLRLTAKKAQKTFAIGFRNAGYLAASVRDNMEYPREIMYETELAWDPIFELDASAMASVGDGIGKINQAYPDYVTKQKMRDLFGF